MASILITGLHGFVGSNLVKDLKEFHTIYGLDIVTPSKEGVVKTFQWNELDKIPNIDLVIHLAGKAHDTKNKTESSLYFNINTELTKVVFEWFLTTKAKKFIFFSSVKAAADNIGATILKEDIIPSPKGPYGESKLAAEQYLTERLKEFTTEHKVEEENERWGEVDTERVKEGEKANASALQPEDKKIYILRPCMIHGPGNKGNLNLLYNVVKKGIPYPLGAFENKRSFTSIDNLSSIITQLIEKEIPGGIYNVADDTSLSTNELIALMAETLKMPNRTWKLNKSFLQFCAKAGTLLHLPLNTARLQKLTDSYVVSNDKLKQALGITRMPVSAKDGLHKTLKSFKKD